MTHEDDRAARLAAQLRANLKRRKAQAREAAAVQDGKAAPVTPDRAERTAR